MAIITLAPLTLYCDASGKDAEGLNVVAGFISTVEEWLLFEKEWAAVLDKYHVRYFHMREFAHSIDEFDGWKGKEDKRRAFICESSASLDLALNTGREVAST